MPEKKDILAHGDSFRVSDPRRISEPVGNAQPTTRSGPSVTPTCGICDEPMPPGEESFVYHGYSGPCPKPPKPKTAKRELEVHLNTAGGYHAQACPCVNSGYRFGREPGMEVDDAAA